MTKEELINQRATTCRHGGHCEWVACDKCNHYEPDALSQQPCEDCISRQAVNDGFKKYANSSFAYGCVWDYINKLPTVTPKEKTGKWIEGGYEDMYYVCSECDYKASEYWHKPFYKYCPNCGARMVSE